MNYSASLPLLVVCGFALTLTAQAADPAPIQSDSLPVAVKKAIDRGSTWLLEAANKDRANPRASARVQALALWALGRSGVKVGELGKGFGWLRSQHKWLADPKEWRAPSGTYSASLILLAHAGAGLVSEFEPTSKSLRHKHRGKRLRGDLFHMVRTSARWIVTTRSRPGEWGYGVMPPPETYPPQIPHHDLSNTQFAVYALYEAELAGVKLPVSIWKHVFKYLLKSQQAKGTPVTLDDCAAFGGSPLVSDTAAKKKKKKKKQLRRTRERSGAARTLARLRVSSKTGAQARGWKYSRLNKKATLNMTAAGLSCLSLASARLDARGKLSASDRRKAARALQDGLAWIKAAWDQVEGLPGAGYREGHGPFYTLWSLEKAFSTCGVEVIAGRPAWEVLARQTLSLQRADGSWGEPDPAKSGSLIDTSLALLVLSRASLYPFDEQGLRPTTGSLERFLAPTSSEKEREWAAERRLARRTPRR